MRWQHPVHGLRGPGAFLPHAEHTALMRPLTLHVLETALSQLAAWRADGLDLHIAVNLAVQNLLDLRTPGQVAELLARHGLPPSVLTLEVTESLMLHDPQRAGEVLADLAALGCRPRARRLRHRVLLARAPQAPAGRTSSRSTSRS